jgi:hypothetical protein
MNHTQQREQARGLSIIAQIQGVVGELGCFTHRSCTISGLSVIGFSFIRGLFVVDYIEKILALFTSTLTI